MQSKYEYMQLAKKYAPIIYLHSKESYKPSSFEFVVKYTYPSIDRTTLILKEQMSSPTERRKWFIGEEDFPIYALVIPEGENLRIYYFLFFPYNHGKRILGMEFGNHVGDWENISILFDRNREPISIKWKYHSITKEDIWRSPSITMQQNRPIFYCSKGSHGMHNKTGKFKYLNKFLWFIYDETDDGIRINTESKLVLILSENFNDFNDTTINSNFDLVSLRTQYGNWTTYRYFGQTKPLKTIKIGSSKMSMLEGYNMIPMAKFRINQASLIN